MTDRRRINGPPGGSTTVVFASSLGLDGRPMERPLRTRPPGQLRKIFLKTGLAPSASGSAYLELSPSNTNETYTSLAPSSPALKLTCTVHGPRPLPRSAPFTPQIQLSTHIKFASFAARQRRGYIRDASERDLAVHLETALRGVIIGDRWPKSSVEVVITVLEGEEDRWWGEESGGGTTGVGNVGGWGMMNVLSGCITVASAAIADAGIDCLDLVSGGVAAIVRTSQNRHMPPDEDADMTEDGQKGQLQLVLDPAPPEHQEIFAACVVGYLSSRDEITELWLKGNTPGPTGLSICNTQSQMSEIGGLVDKAVEAAVAARLVLEEAVREAAEIKVGQHTRDKE
ncbi:MAG: 3'-5'-exoribonuclease [Geoglossum simile]|nr:MAG: 3'-5'-exoribonuclease [Geoglossum simile]